MVIVFDTWHFLKINKTFLSNISMVLKSTMPGIHATNCVTVLQSEFGMIGLKKSSQNGNRIEYMAQFKNI